MSEDSTRYIYTHISKNYFFFTSPQCVRTRFALLHSFLSERFFLSTFSLLQKQKKKKRRTAWTHASNTKNTLLFRSQSKWLFFVFWLIVSFPPFFWASVESCCQGRAFRRTSSYTHTYACRKLHSATKTEVRYLLQKREGVKQRNGEEEVYKKFHLPSETGRHRKKKKKTVFTISLKARGFLEARLPFFFFCTDKEMKEEKTPFKYARSSFISHFKPLFF